MDPGLVPSSWCTASGQQLGPTRQDLVMSPVFNQTHKHFFKTQQPMGPKATFVKKKARFRGRHLTWESASLDWVPPLHSHVEPPKHSADTPTLSRPSPQFGARSPPQGLSSMVTLPLGDLMVDSGFPGKSAPQAWSPWISEARTHSSRDPRSVTSTWALSESHPGLRP